MKYVDSVPSSPPLRPSTEKEPVIFSTHPFWSLIDGIICINKDEATGRWELFRRRAQGVIPTEKLHRMSAVVGELLPGYGKKPWFTARTGDRSMHWARSAGCMLSHRNAIRTAQENGWHNVLILEDDAVPEMSEEGLDASARAVKELVGKWIYYLGYSDSPRPCGGKLWQQGAYSLWSISGVMTTHAYIVPQSMYADIAAALPGEDSDVWPWMAQHHAIDHFYSNTVGAWRGVRTYALLPHLYYQDYFYSRYGELPELPNEQHGIGECLSRHPKYPRTLCGMFRLLYPAFAPLRRIKVRLNGLRSLCLSRCIGYRGWGKRRKGH